MINNKCLDRKKLAEITIEKKEKGKDEILNHRPITATAQSTDHATGKSTVATTATGMKSISQILVIQNNDMCEHDL